jgi:hypothetical protein
MKLRQYINSPKTAEYLKAEYDKGPCAHNPKRNIPMMRNGHIDIYGQWNKTANGTFVQGAKWVTSPQAPSAPCRRSVVCEAWEVDMYTIYRRVENDELREVASSENGRQQSAS